MRVSTAGLPLNTSAEDLLAAVDAARQHPDETRARLLAELQAYEDTYGYPSGAVRDLVRTGVLTETHEICSWVFTYDAFVRFRS